MRIHLDPARRYTLRLDWNCPHGHLPLRIGRPRMTAREAADALRRYLALTAGTPGTLHKETIIIEDDAGGERHLYR